MAPPIKRFIDLSLVDWDGRVSCVVFTPGCNFRCPWCYNRDLVLRPSSLPDVPLEYVLSYVREAGWGLDGVVITGGEPTIWPDLPELCTQLKELGLAVKLDTNGTNPSMLEHLISSGLVDYIAMDVKAPLELEPYSRATGINAQPFLPALRQSIEIITTSGIEHEFRTTLVPGIHRPGDVRAICQVIKDCRLYVLQVFKPMGPTIDPSFSSAQPPSQEALMAFYREAVEVLGAKRVKLRS